MAFRELSGIRLRAKAITTRDSPFGHLHTRLDLHYANGGKQEWQTASFTNNLRVLQCFVEAFAVYRAGLKP